MIAVPKLVLLILLVFVVWQAVRWFNRVPPKAVRQGSARWTRSAARTPPAVKDLVSCRICGAYVAADARGCGKAGCPRPA